MKQLSIFSVIFTAVLFSANAINAATLVYVPLGSGTQIVKIDADTDTIIASYGGIENPNRLVATPDGEYLIAGNLQEKAIEEGQDVNAANSELAMYGGCDVYLHSY
ncbi:MAG: hypothetical protein JKX75_01165 [Gammaproteobacteria bacterium]|nr:hypothetical protein [Gammaproteobacteria bacterium]